MGQICPKLPKTDKINHTIEFCIFELVSVPYFSFNWQFRFFGLNLLKKDISGRKQKNREFACAHGHYLTYLLNFPYRGLQKQRYFNVSSPSSRRDNKWAIIVRLVSIELTLLLFLPVKNFLPNLIQTSAYSFIHIRRTHYYYSGMLDSSV